MSRQYSENRRGCQAAIGVAAAAAMLECAARLAFNSRPRRAGPGGTLTMSRLVDQLQRRILILDGAMGTMIQSYGLGEAEYRGERFKDHPCALKGNNDLLSLPQPRIIGDIHRAYLEAGADILETNSFNSTSFAMSVYRMELLVY